MVTIDNARGRVLREPIHVDVQRILLGRGPDKAVARVLDRDLQGVLSGKLYRLHHVRSNDGKEYLGRKIETGILWILDPSLRLCAQVFKGGELVPCILVRHLLGIGGGGRIGPGPAPLVRTEILADTHARGLIDERMIRANRLIHVESGTTLLHIVRKACVEEGGRWAQLGRKAIPVEIRSPCVGVDNRSGGEG